MFFNQQLMHKELDGQGGVLQRNPQRLQPVDSDEWTRTLSQLKRHKGVARIVTYSLPDMDYIKAHVGGRSTNIWLICHSTFEKAAIDIKTALSDMHIAVKDNIYQKVLLLEPKTVCVTIGSFGARGRKDTIIGMKSQEAHDDYVEDSFKKLWEDSREIVV